MAWLKMVPAWGWLSIVLGLWTVFEEVRIASLRSDLAEEREARRDDAAKLGACRETRGSLLVQVGEQNQALADLQQAETERAARAKQAQGQAKAQAEQDYQAANRLQQERSGGDACAAAESVIDKELGL